MVGYSHSFLESPHWKMFLKIVRHISHRNKLFEVYLFIYQDYEINTIISMVVVYANL